MKKYIWLFSLFYILVCSVPVFALSITAMDSAENLAQSLVGSGITISNVTYTGATVASGYFSGGLAAGLGFDSGIVLTSGFVSNLSGVSNTADDITGDNGLAGDADLNALIPGYYTHDATILAFDFVVASGTDAYFNFAFGSDEYNEWVGSSYNDVFGFFFNGTNVALIPGTSTPVSINNINNSANAAYYHDNDPSDTGSPYPFEYDGFTDSFAASLLGLTAGQTYHIKLAIADAGDHIFDSGVFLQAESFSDEIIPSTEPVPEPATLLLLSVGMAGVAGLRRKRRG